MRKYEILLVDDDLHVLEVIGSILENLGYKVTTANNGQTAFEMLNKKNFDLVITDLVMEEVDGIKVLKKVKELNPNTMVIILTGYGDMLSALDALKLDADDYIFKPCETNELCFCVSRCFKKLELIEKIKIQENRVPFW